MFKNTAFRVLNRFANYPLHFELFSSHLSYIQLIAKVLTLERISVDRSHPREAFRELTTNFSGKVERGFTCPPDNISSESSGIYLESTCMV